MTIKKSWDIFCSYNNDNKQNRQRVIDIRNYLVSNLNITTWIDVLEVQSGEKLRKVYEGVTNSNLFLCFVSSDYSDNKDCINELCLAKNFGKKIIFFINEDVSGMKQEMLAINVLKEVTFYMGDTIYYRNKEELLEAIKLALQNSKVISL